MKQMDRSTKVRLGLTVILIIFFIGMVLLMTVPHNVPVITIKFADEKTAKADASSAEKTKQTETVGQSLTEQEAYDKFFKEAEPIYTSLDFFAKRLATPYMTTLAAKLPNRASREELAAAKKSAQEVASSTYQHLAELQRFGPSKVEQINIEIESLVIYLKKARNIAEMMSDYYAHPKGKLSFKGLSSIADPRYDLSYIPPDPIDAFADLEEHAQSVYESFANLKEKRRG